DGRSAVVLESVFSRPTPNLARLFAARPSFPPPLPRTGRSPMHYLMANNGPQAGRKYELKGDKSIIGRHPDCHIVIEVGAVSRNHCQIIRDGNRYLLEDLGS